MKRLIKNRVFIGIILAVCVAALICCSILLPFTGKKKASDAYVGANLGSLTFSDYTTRTDGNIFDGDVLKKLFGAMTGSTKDDKTATLDEATEAVQGSTSTVIGSLDNGNNAITHSSTMNYTQLTANAKGTITVGLGGLTWNVVYATIAGGDLVATLWQSENSGSSQWNLYYDRDMSGDYPASMYSTSYIRMYALNGGATSGSTSYATSTTQLGGTVSEAQRKNNQYAAFTLDSATIGQKSLVNYLVKPNQMAYQADENFVWAVDGLPNRYLLSNEAWGSPDESVTYGGSGGWVGSFYGSQYDDIYLMPSKGGYNDWANDTLWLPSFTETGCVDINVSLWGIPYCDPILTSSGDTWSRSGHDQFAGCAFGWSASGGYLATTTDAVYEFAAIRPALHINLTKAMKDAGESVTKPSDVKVTYNGNNQTLATIPADKRPDWYDAAFYGDSSKVTVTYSLSNASTLPKNVGEYTATVTLNSTKYKWADSSSFTSDRSRTFKFKIEPKKIEVKVQDSDNDGIPDKVDCDATQMLGTPPDSVPNFTLIYGNTIGGNDFASVPTNQGTYYATAKITDTPCNYEIDTSKTTYYLQFGVQSAVTKPYFTSGGAGTYTATAKYTGSNLTFDLNGVNTNVQVLAQGSGISVNGSSLIVSGGVGTYKATVSLVNASDNKWSDNTTASYDLEITITKGDYDFTNVKWQYKSNGVWVDFPSDNNVTYTGSAIDMQVTGLPTGLSVLSTSYTGTGNTNAGDYTAQVTNLNGVDAVNYNAVTVSSITEFTFKYTIKKKQVNIGAWSNTTQTSGGNSFTIPTLPADNAYTVVYYVDTDWDTTKNEPKSGATALSASQITYSSTASQNYYAYAQLSSNVNYQNNYELTGTLFQQFSVGGGKTAVTLSVPVTSKTYDGAPFNVQADAADSGGSTVGLALDYTYYESDGVTQLSSAPTNAGSYVVKVAIGSANADDYAIDGTSTFTFTINQATIDLSKLVWQWQYVGDSAWNNFSDGMPVFKKGYGVSTRVDTSNLPAGLSADDFDIQEEKPLPSSLGAHSTTIAFKPQLKDSNYVRPSDNTYSWQITKKIIKVTTWVPGVMPDENGDEQGVKVVDCHEDYAGVLEYLYSFTYTDKDGISHTVTNMAGAAALTLLYTYADAETVIPVTVRVDLTDTVNYEFSNDSVLSSTFNAGDGLEKVTVAVTGSGSTYGDVNLGVTATLKDGSSVNGEFYTVKICDKNGEVLKELAADDLNDPANYRDVLKDAGDYIIKVALTELGEKNGYYLSGATSEYKILPKEISAPVIAGTVSFTGSDIDVSGYFDGDFAKYVSDGIVEIAGGTVNRNAGDYKAYLKIVNSNYAWKEEEGVVVNDAELVLPWTIGRAVLTTDSWNLKGKNGAVLNALANWQSKINAGEVSVGLDYRYYDNDRLQLQDVEFKGGSTYFVDAVLTGEDANNFEFADGLGEDKSITPMVEYKVPKSGAAVFFGSIGEFFENYWQPFVSGVCIVLSAIFAGLIGHFDSQRRKANKEAKQYKMGTATNEPKQYKTAAVAATGLFGLAYATWTIIACVLIGLAVALFIGIFIAKARRNKAREALEAAKIEYAENKVVLAEQAKQDEADRLKKEQADEREEEKRRRDEEREEERRRREEERDEEKRRKEEEREEEKRRREEQREEERRRREEEREDERRRREDERRIAAMSNNNMGMGMGYGAMSPFAMQYAQPPVVQQQPVVMQPAQPQTVQMVQPAQQVIASTDESKLEKAVEKLATELGHQKRVEGFLDMISKSREKDQAALAQSEKALEERKKKFEARRENMSAPFEPSVQRVYIPAMPANGNSREKELELELRAKEKELELEREKNKGEKVVQAPQTVAQQPVVQPAPQPVVQPVIQQVPVQVPVQAPVYPQPMYMPQGYMPSPYWQAPMPQGYAQPSYREYELERELERMRVRDYERMRNLEHELGIDRDRNFYVGQIKSNTPAQSYAQPALPQPQQVVMPQSYVQPQIPQSYTQATVRELELERDLREKERERTRELERELALEKERNRFAQEKPTVTAQPNTQPQPVVVVPPIVQTQPSEQQQQEVAQPAPARFLRRNNPFAANRFAEGNDD